MSRIRCLPILFLLGMNVASYAVADILRTECLNEGLFTNVENDKALVGHVIATHSVRSSIECAMACTSKPGCLSCNIDVSQKVCELNNETKQTKPGDLKSSPGSNYYDSESIPVCHNGGTPIDICRSNHGVMCTCTPRWTGDDCNIPRVGSVDYMPGQSCRSINTAGDAVGDDNYWIKPPNTNDTFKVFCHMSLLGVWQRVTMSWYHSMATAGVSITKTEVSGGLQISGSVTNYGCGGGTGSGSIIYIKGYWTKIKYTQEFKGISSCWRIFGNVQFNNQGGAIGQTNHGLCQFDKTKDTITNELYMGGPKSHLFPGTTIRCDHLSDNLWQNSVSGGVRRATVTLRRNASVTLAGIYTSTSCGRPQYVIKDIYIYF
ncbi:uncharacterized protein LOC116305637 [Actinia tenebrosa]|uniref:Uncharacterized protein LOC116305637 n=1 Tax=Actinia tenebrosa TaxID=6105 RepID=A0A6P8IVW7_ACTTE|nr:uncharacterized protein LOC116305637 [Actinia tenebrosa]